jgi:NADPH:quinone reductase-like Zn-dependent oxidoreductase
LLQEIIKLTTRHDENGNRGVDAVFDGIGGRSLRLSYKILRNGGRLVAYGLISTLKDGRHSKPDQIITNIKECINWMSVFALNLVPDKRNVILYSIQMLKRRKPMWFREDLTLLFDMLKQGKISPIIAVRMPLRQAAQAHKLLASGSLKGGKIVLICD